MLRKSTITYDDQSPAYRYSDGWRRSQWVRVAMDARYELVASSYQFIRRTYGLAELIGELEIGTRGQYIDVLRDEMQIFGCSARDLCAQLEEIVMEVVR